MKDYKNYGHVKQHQIKAGKAIVVVFSFLLLYGFAGYVDNTQAPVVNAVQKSATQVNIEKLLPEMPTAHAKAIAETTTYPRTLAAIAHTETRGRNIKGDSGASVGYFQIQPRHWGHVDENDGMQQIEKANSIFTGLVEQHGYRKAIAMWNGNPKLPQVKRYQKSVLQKVAMLERGGQ